MPKKENAKMVYGTGEYRYELVEGWAKCPPGWKFVDIGGLSIDAQDRLYVLSRCAHSVMVFDREGNLLSSFGEGLFKRAHGTCIGPDGSVYCTDDGDHTVSKFTPDGKVLLTIGKKGQPSDTGYKLLPNLDEALATITRGGPPFNRPTGVALSKTGEIYVTDGYGNARVHKFTREGTLLYSWGEPGRGPGQFRLPHSVRVDKKERVWVCDRENSRIQIFNAGGEFITQWDDIGGKPTDIFFGPEGVLYVSLKSESRPFGVSIFNMDGEVITRWGAQGPDEKTAMFVTPHAITVDSHGDIYIGEIRHEMAKFDRDNRALQKFARIT
jgi:DNA-binding beta-propeller fold protein YncE